jgi:penicillin-binding protein 1C
VTPWVRLQGWWRARKTTARRRRNIALGLGALLFSPLIALCVTAASLPLPAELSNEIPDQSLRVEDRDGNLLREVRTTDGALSRWVTLDQVPAFFIDALVAVEDRHFYEHPGVDPLALLRASAQWVSRGRVISGASTLSMQLARNLRPHPRTLFGKFCEMALALRIEASLSKAEILEQYINRVDFGPNLRGIAAASQSYFARTPSQLSEFELATLAGLPQSPTAYALNAGTTRALKRRAHVLERMHQEGFISAVELERIGSQPVEVATRRSAFGAPHFVTALTQGSFAALQPDLGNVMTEGTFRLRTTLDGELQRAIEVAVTRHLESLREHDVSAVAAILVDHTRGDILAYVGSPDFYSRSIQGQVDGVRALRQPGSTLKPFVYAAAFHELGYDPATPLADVEFRIDTPQGGYTPRNYDDRFRGPVRLREALANSLNVPAVRTAVALGPDTLLRHLHGLGFDSLSQSPDHYGPALALGDGEVTLLELVRAYATLARGGRQAALRAVLEAESTKAGVVARSAATEVADVRLMPEATAALITDMLKDRAARSQTFGRGSSLEFEFDVAVKTGTSTGYRDNWAVGYTDRFALGVWVGNFDGRPMFDVSGATGAAPIFAAILRAVAIEHHPGSLPLEPGGALGAEAPRALGLEQVEVCPLSGMRRTAACPKGIREWLPRATERADCDWHQHLAIDRRNGLLAGPGCAGSVVDERDVELLPAEYAQWAHDAGRSRGPLGTSPHCPLSENAGSSGQLEIMTPRDGARFVLDPDRPRELQRLQIAISAEAWLGRPQLEIDGDKLVALDASLRFDWLMQPGEHVFVAVGERGERSAPVRVSVRAAI